jgi:hypothetical protein
MTERTLSSLGLVANADYSRERVSLLVREPNGAYVHRKVHRTTGSGAYVTDKSAAEGIRYIAQEDTSIVRARHTLDSGAPVVMG